MKTKILKQKLIQKLKYYCCLQHSVGYVMSILCAKNELYQGLYFDTRPSCDE